MRDHRHTEDDDSEMSSLIGDLAPLTSDGEDYDLDEPSNTQPASTKTSVLQRKSSKSQPVLNISMDQNNNPDDLENSMTSQSDESNPLDLFSPLQRRAAHMLSLDSNYLYASDIEPFTAKQGVNIMLKWTQKHMNDIIDASALALMEDEVIPPKYNPELTGKFWKCMRSKRTITGDSYKPWSRTVEGVPYVKPRYGKLETVKIGDREYTVTHDTAVHFTNAHLKKQMFRYLSHDDAEDVVLLVYIFEEKGMTMPDMREKDTSISSSTKSGRTDKAIMALYREALTNRDIEHARQHLREHLNVREEDMPSNRQLLNAARQVTSFQKKKRGRRPGTDPIQLTALVSTEPGLFVHTGRVTDDSTDPDPKLEVRAFYICEEALKVFVNGMPDSVKIDDHRIDMDNLTYLSRDEIKARIANLASDTGGSVSLDGCCAVVQADTTFNLVSDMCVTFIVGLLSKFRTASSDKDRPLILGFTIHSNRKAPTHNEMGRRLRDALDRINPGDKRVTAIVTDGETTLMECFQGPTFEMAIHLRCDVHRKSNLETDLAHMRKEDRTRFFRELYGSSQVLATGERIYCGGSLSELSRKAFQKSLNRLKVLFDDPILSAMLDKRAKKLYDANGLLAKMKGGLVVQHITTNATESNNARVQARCTRPEGAHKAVAELIAICKEDVKELFRATLDDSTVVKLASVKSVTVRRTKAQWKEMGLESKLKYLRKFGLPEHYAEEHRQIPSWVLRRNPNVRKHVAKLRVTQPSGMPHGNYTVANKDTFLKAANLVAQKKRILCGDLRCQERPNLKTHPCRHIVAVLVSMHYTVAQPFWKWYESNNSSRTLAQLMLQQRAADAGQKRRKGSARSKNNDRRGALEQITFHADMLEDDSLEQSKDDISVEGLDSSIVADMSAITEGNGDLISSLSGFPTDNEDIGQYYGDYPSAVDVNNGSQDDESDNDDAWERNRKANAEKARKAAKAKGLKAARAYRRMSSAKKPATKAKRVKKAGCAVNRAKHFVSSTPISDVDAPIVAKKAPVRKRKSKSIDSLTTTIDSKVEAHRKKAAARKRKSDSLTRNLESSDTTPKKKAAALRNKAKKCSSDIFDSTNEESMKTAVRPHTQPNQDILSTPLQPECPVAETRKPLKRNKAKKCSSDIFDSTNEESMKTAVRPHTQPNQAAHSTIDSAEKNKKRPMRMKITKAIVSTPLQPECPVAETKKPLKRKMPEDHSTPGNESKMRRSSRSRTAIRRFTSNEDDL